MYKVFLNERKITIAAWGEITQNVSAEKFTAETNSQDVRNWFRGYADSSLKDILLLHPEPEKFFAIFSKAFLNLPAAGGVVKSEEKLLFIFRNGKWDLPKGKLEKEETPRAAALREVEEECGITDLSIIKNLPETYHIYQSPHKSDGYKWVLKKTNWFEMSYTGTDSGKPQTKEGITRLKWFTKNEMDEVWNNTYENLKQIIALYRD